MKKNILLITTIVFCSLIVYLCIFVRGELRRNEIMNEMSGRLEILLQHTNAITAAEYTPFIWDAEYSYIFNTTLEDFNTLIEGKTAEYLFIDEKEYRELYFYNDNIVLDTRDIRGNNWYYILGGNRWYFFYTGKILPRNQLNIYMFEHVSIQFFNDEDEREKFEEHFGVGGNGQ